jgi:hypothetical protein
MTARFTDETSALHAEEPGRGAAQQSRSLERLRALANDHLRHLAQAHHRHPRPLPDTSPSPVARVRAEVGVRPDTHWANSVTRLPHSHAVRSACGLTSFLGLLSPGGTLLEANQSSSTPPEFEVHDALGRPFWEVPWWVWSPIVQDRLRETVAKVAAGQVVRYAETALVRRNQLITVDLALAPCSAAGRPTGLICSVVDLSGSPDHARSR